jgi:hypothetical protein
MVFLNNNLNIKQTEKFRTKLTEEFELNKWETLGLSFTINDISIYNVKFYGSKPISCITLDFLPGSTEKKRLENLKAFIYHLKQSKKFEHILSERQEKEHIPSERKAPGSW